MASFFLPKKELIPDEVRPFLPENWDGVSNDEMLASLWQDFDPDKNVIHESLFDVKTLKGVDFKLLWEGMMFTFPEWGVKAEDYWSYSNIDSYDDVVYTLRLVKRFGNIIENGIYSQLNTVSKSLRNLSGNLPETVLSQSSRYLDFDTIERGLQFCKFLKRNGVYTSLNNSYIYLMHTSEEEAVKLLAKNLDFFDYLKFCALGLTTYAEIYNDYGETAIDSTFLNQIIFGEEEEDKENE